MFKSEFYSEAISILLLAKGRFGEVTALSSFSS